MRLSLSSLIFLAACAEPPAEAEPTPPPTPEVCGPDADFGIRVGRCAPDFTLPDRTDTPFTLSSQRGKVALVDISAVW